MKHTVSSLERALTVLIAVLIIGSAIAYVYAGESARALRITAETYDRWLKPCTCYGGTLRVALPSDITTLNWWVAGASWDLLTLDLIYDRPLRIVNGTLTWEVAEWLEYSSDYLVLTMGIKKGIRFHDGVELTAEDVAFTINVLANKTWTYYHGYFTSVDRAEVVDKYTLRIVFKQPDSQFVLNSLTVIRIMPKHIWEPLLSSMGDELSKYSPKPTELIGSGPFKFVERVAGQYIKFTVNKDYWMGRPCIDEILLIPITDVSIVILGIQRGDLDVYAWGVDAAVVPTLLANPNVGIHVYTSEFFYHWGLNNLVWPLNISKFRLALSYAVNREAIVRDILLGYGIPGSPGVVAPVGSCAPWYNPNVEKLVYYDPKKANEILDEIGFTDKDGDGWRDGPNGEQVVIEIYSPTAGYDPIRARAAEFIKSDLEKIKIKAVVYYYEWAALWPLIREGKVMSWLLGSGWSPDIGWLNFRFRSRPEGAGNWARYSNPEVDALIVELLSTFDFEKRKELAWKIQEKIALDAPIINLYYRSYPNPYRTDKFEGWFYDTADSVFNRITVLRLGLKTAVCPTPVTPTPTPTPTLLPHQHLLPHYLLQL
ncbi:MAG: ABC transporter substrate-binding protein [Sulfolobales archaeon]